MVGLVDSQAVTIGIDESGILASIGPRPYIGVVSFALNSLKNLDPILNDKRHFKRLRTINEQERIIAHIQANAITFQAFPVEYNVLNYYRKQKLGRHEVECILIQDIAISAAEELLKSGYNVNRIVVDKIKKVLKPVEYYFNEKVKSIIEQNTNSRVIVVEEAGKKFKECTAAWIIAHAAFEAEKAEMEKKFGEIGSGHPADRRTKKWLTEYYAGNRNFGSIPHQSESALMHRFSHRWFQIIDVRWRVPNNQSDVGRGLSSPYFILKDLVADPLGRNLEYVNLRRDARINISVYERRCPGTWPNAVYEPCSYLDLEGIYGRLLPKGDMCFDCRATAPPMKCFFNPDCNGYPAACGLDEFGAFFCGNLHANYMLLFGDVLKIGQTLYYNLSQRLLEQGSACALVYSLAPNRKIARAIERKTVEILKRNPEALKQIGISCVREKAPNASILLRQFSENWSSRNFEKLCKSYELLNALRGDLVYSECLLDEPIEMDLIGDYMEPEIKAFDNSTCDKINGKVIGFRGHFLYINCDAKGIVLDVDCLKYRIINGEVAYGS